MDPKALVAIAGMISAAAVACTALTVWATRQRIASPATLPHDQEARMQHLEQVIESMASELERLGDSQQFTNRLLMERPATDPLMIERTARESAPAIVSPTAYRPIITPH